MQSQNKQVTPCAFTQHAAPTADLKTAQRRQSEQEDIGSTLRATPRRPPSTRAARTIARSLRAPPLKSQLSEVDVTLEQVGCTAWLTHVAHVSSCSADHDTIPMVQNFACARHEHTLHSKTQAPETWTFTCATT